MGICSAERAYATLAPYYDEFTRHHRHDVWLAGLEAPLHRADMRALPRSIGTFDWITCLDDALNYLLGDDDLARALASMARLLRPGGLLTFDLNSLNAHRAGFAATWVVEEPGLSLCWEGRGCAREPGEPGCADISIFESADGAWLRRAAAPSSGWSAKLRKDGARCAWPARAPVCQLRGQWRWGNWTTETKKSSIWRTTSMKRSKSTGLLT
jgi:SAM-dependent methyltransferase